MAMIKCPDCGASVSDRAQTCPKCGFPIQEEVARIKAESEIKAEEITSKFGNLDEKSLAQELLENIRKDDFSVVNTFQNIFQQNFPNSPYLTVIQESRTIEDVEIQNIYLLKNIEVIVEYLDAPLDPNGFSTWIKDKEKKNRGFYQITDDSFVDFEDFYSKTKAIKVVSLTSGFISLEFPSDIFQRMQSVKIILLEQNVDNYKNLEEKSIAYFKAKQNINNIHIQNKSTIKYAEDFYLDKRSISMGDFEYITSWQINKTVVDTVEIMSRQLHAATTTMIDSLRKDISKPMSVGSSTIVGTALVGLPGAIIGYAVGKDRMAKYDYVKAYNEKVRSEKEKAFDALRDSELPTKEIKTYRYMLGIKTYAGMIPVIVDEDEKETEAKYEYKGTIYGPRILIDKCRYGNEDSSRSDLLADIFLKEGKLLPSGKAEKHSIELAKQGHSLSEIENIIANEMSGRISHLNTIDELSEIKDILVTFENNQVAQNCVKQIEAKMEKISAEEQRIALEKQAEADRLRIQKEKEAEEQRKLAEIENEKLERRRNKMWRIIASCAVAGVIVSCLIYAFIKIYVPNAKYNNAVELVNSGNYSEAQEIFTGLRDFKNSNDYITYCKGMESFSNEDYKTAKLLLLPISDFYDVSERLLEIDNEEKIAKENEKKINETRAFEYFDVGDYENAYICFENSEIENKEKYVEYCKCALEAQQMKDRTNLSLLYGRIKALSNFQDADSIINNNKYLSLIDSWVGVWYANIGKVQKDSIKAQRNLRLEIQSDGKVHYISDLILGVEAGYDRLCYFVIDGINISMVEEVMLGAPNDKRYRIGYSNNSIKWQGTTFNKK